MKKNPTSKSPILIKKGIKFLEQKMKRVISVLRAKYRRNQGENRDISAI